MDIRRKLKAAARRTATTTAAREKAMAERDELIREAIAANIPRAEIATLAEVSEDRVYQVRRGARV